MTRDPEHPFGINLSCMH